MKNLIVFSCIFLFGILFACDSFEKENILNTNETGASTRSISNLEPALSYGLEEYNNLLSSFSGSPQPDARPTNYPDYYGGAYINKDNKLAILVLGNPEDHREGLSRDVALKTSF